MRYAYGVFLGAILSLIAFIISTVIQLVGLGISEPGEQAFLWNLFVIWSIISLVVVLLPSLVFYFTNRELFRRVTFLVLGSVFLFSPLWLMLSIEMIGESSIGTILTDGIGGIPFPGVGGSIQGMNIGPILSIVILVGFAVIGLFLLRPSFIDQYETATPKPRKVKVTTEETPTSTKEDTIEVDMPGVSRPVPDESSIDELKQLLSEMDVTEAIVNRIITAGYATVTDLVAAKPEHLAAAAGIDMRGAEKLLLDIQKKVWFGGI